MWEGWEGCTRSPPGLRTTAPRIDGTRARFPRFPHPPPPLRRCLWEGWEGRPRPHPPAAPGPSHSERARARFPRFPQDSTAIPAALRPKDPWHNAPRRRQAAEKTKNGRKPAGFAASPHHRRPLSYPLAFSWRVHRENWPALLTLLATIPLRVARSFLGLSGVLPVPQRFGATRRRDPWWITPTATFVGLSAFVVYSTWAVFAHHGAEFGNYVSPIHVPVLFGDTAHA